MKILKQLAFGGGWEKALNVKLFHFNMYYVKVQKSVKIFC